MKTDRIEQMFSNLKNSTFFISKDQKCFPNRMVIQIKRVALKILQNDLHFRRLQSVSFPCSTISDLVSLLHGQNLCF